MKKPGRKRLRAALKEKVGFLSAEMQELGYEGDIPEGGNSMSKDGRGSGNHRLRLLLS